MSRLWIGPEVEPPHLGRSTLFVEGYPPHKIAKRAIDAAEAVYFGAGRRSEFDSWLLAYAVRSGKPVVLEVRDPCDAEVVPGDIRPGVELVFAAELGNGWREVRLKDDTDRPVLRYYMDALSVTVQPTREGCNGPLSEDKVIYP